MLCSALMAIVSSRTSLSNLSRLQTLIFNLQRLNHTLAGDPGFRKQGDSNSECNSIGTCNNDVNLDMSLWRAVNSKVFGINTSRISNSSWTVMAILRKKGFKAYLVGGCVRDLLIDKIPKDFDVVTTAELKQIKKSFHKAHIVGRRFPICHVYLQGSMVEVSSFHTVVKGIDGEEPTFVSQGINDCTSEDIVRWKNCLKRDFTINSLFYDPSANKIYDYTNGMRDLKLGKVQTVIPAHLSFREDCARIFRGIRIAARLGLSLSEETASAIHDLYLSLLDLDKQRMVLEMDYMFSYGAASSSLSLLRRFKILDIVLPFHAAYLSAQRNDLTAQGSSMLFKLFSSMDKLVACDRPCTPSLWIGLLAFHMALVKNPQDALLIWAFSSILYYGNWKEAVKFSREKSKVHVRFSPEISETSRNRSDKTLAEDVNRFASQVIDSIDILTERQSLVQSMEKYPLSPSSGLVFISKYKGRAAAKLFDTKSYHTNRKSFEIDYKLLKGGDVVENRFVLGNIIMDMMSSGVDLDQQLDVHQLPLSDSEEQNKVLEKENNYSQSRQMVQNEKDLIQKKIKKNQMGNGENRSQNFSMHIMPSSDLEQRSEAVNKEKTMRKKAKEQRSEAVKKEKTMEKKDEKQIKKNQLGKEQNQSQNFSMHIMSSSHLEQRSEAVKKEKTMEKKDKKHSHDFNMHIMPSSHLEQRSEALTMKKKDSSQKSGSSKMAEIRTVKSLSDKSNINDIPSCLKQPPEAVEKERSPLISSHFAQQQNTINKNDLSHNSTTTKWEDVIESDDEQGHQSYSTKQNQHHQSESNRTKDYKLSSLFR